MAAYASYVHQRAFALQTRREHAVVWTAFLLGIAVSLAAAPTLAWQPALVVGGPPSPSSSR